MLRAWAITQKAITSFTWQQQHTYIWWGEKSICKLFALPPVIKCQVQTHSIDFVTGVSLFSSSTSALHVSWTRLMNTLLNTTLTHARVQLGSFMLLRNQLVCLHFNNIIKLSTRCASQFFLRNHRVNVTHRQQKSSMTRIETSSMQRSSSKANKYKNTALLSVSRVNKSLYFYIFFWTFFVVVFFLHHRKFNAHKEDFSKNFLRLS